MVPNANTPIQDLIEFFGDGSFNPVGTIAARQIAKVSKAPVYEYLFTYDPIFGLGDLFTLSYWKLVAKV